MKITGIRAYQAELEYDGEAYAFSQGRYYQRLTTTILALDTDAGITGYGEACPCGPSYIPAFAESMIPALHHLAPAVIGLDPRNTLAVVTAMDRAMVGQDVAKTLIDLACWDLLGKACDQPVYRLLGGAMMPSIPLHRVVPLGSPEKTVARVAALRQQGYNHFQIKAGQAVDTDVAVMRAVHQARQPADVYMVDANTAWRRDEAVRFSQAIRDVDCYLEQPCPGLWACQSVRRRVHHPMKLDESMESVRAVREAIAADAMDAMALKITRYGGLTKARVVRDICADAGIAMTIEDAWGGGITTAAIAHLAISTPPEALLNATDLHRYNTHTLSQGAPDVAHGRMTISDRPGLGTEPDWDALGAAVYQYSG